MEVIEELEVVVVVCALRKAERKCWCTDHIWMGQTIEQETG